MLLSWRLWEMVDIENNMWACGDMENLLSVQLDISQERKFISPSKHLLFFYYMNTLTTRRSQLHVSKRECIAIHSWCKIEGVIKWQQLIGDLKHKLSVVEIPIKHSNLCNKWCFHHYSMPTFICQTQCLYGLSFLLWRPCSQNMVLQFSFLNKQKTMLDLSLLQLLSPQCTDHMCYAQ